jgi:hypothetical protein
MVKRMEIHFEEGQSAVERGEEEAGKEGCGGVVVVARRSVVES